MLLSWNPWKSKFHSIAPHLRAPQGSLLSPGWDLVCVPSLCDVTLANFSSSTRVILAHILFEKSMHKSLPTVCWLRHDTDCSTAVIWFRFQTFVRSPSIWRQACLLRKPRSLESTWSFPDSHCPLMLGLLTMQCPLCLSTDGLTKTAFHFRFKIRQSFQDDFLRRVGATRDFLP